MLGTLSRLTRLGGLVSFRRITVNSVRKSSSEDLWQYRSIKKDIKTYNKVRSELVMSLMWYFVLWHLWYNSEKLTGHHPYVKPEDWTDEELGIPPIDK